MICHLELSLRENLFCKKHPPVGVISKRSRERDGLPQWKSKQWDLHKPNLNLGNENYFWRLSGGMHTKTLHNWPLFLILLEIIMGPWNEYELRDMVSSFWVSSHEMTVA